MLSDIILDIGKNEFCDNGRCKRDYKEEKDMCFLSLSNNKDILERVGNKCKYMKGCYTVSCGRKTYYFSICTYAEKVNDTL